MSYTSDFLIWYDTAETAEERADLLSDEFRRQIERDAFQGIIDNEMARAAYEMMFNGSIRFEDFAPLQKAGLVFNQADFYPRILFGEHRLDLIPDINLTPAGHRWDIKIAAPFEPSRFIAPYIQGYLWRSTKGGIVTSRDPLEDALQIGDVDVLRLIKNPLTGQEYLPVEHPDIWDIIVDQTPPEDIHASRRSQVQWWAEESRSTILHDMSGQLPGSEYFTFMDDGSYYEAILIDPRLTYHDHYLKKCRERARTNHPTNLLESRLHRE